jgi:hypothetical protein
MKKDELREKIRWLEERMAGKPWEGKPYWKTKPAGPTWAEELARLEAELKELG